MALLDFMKQGTQWLTDNTGMDWNTVQRDPGMAAKRLMGGTCRFKLSATVSTITK